SSLRGKMTAPRRSPEATSDRQVALAPTAPSLASTSFEVNPDGAARPVEAPSAPVAASVAPAAPSNSRTIIKPAYPRATDDTSSVESRDESLLPATKPRSISANQRGKSPRTIHTLPSRPPLKSMTGEFAVVQSLSLKDRSLARSMLLADGVEVR